MSINNNTSFNGYGRVSMSKEQYFKRAGYIVEGKFSPLRIESNYCLNCKLCDDESGNHLQKLLESAKRWHPFYRKRACKENGDIELRIDHIEYKFKDSTNKEFISIMFNDTPLFSLEKSGLAVYEYLAKLTTSLIKSNSTSPTQKEFLEEMNDHINNQAFEILDC